MEGKNLFRKYRNFCKIITLQLLAIFLSFASGKAGIPAIRGQKRGENHVKILKHSQFRQQFADSQNVIDLGKIYIAPEAKGAAVRPRFEDPKERLKRLDHERREILQTLKRLESKMRQRRKRRQISVRRPCV